MSIKRAYFCLLSSVVAVVAWLGAQAPERLPSVEVASVKKNTSGDSRSPMRTQPGGRFVVTDARLKGLIATAFDKTGLTGRFAFNLARTPDRIPTEAPPPGIPPLDPNGPSLFTALQEQLGLKLEPAKGQVDVLVIDSVEHPAED